MKNNLETNTIAIIGLGYVGLPLAVEFSKKFNVVGYDINANRISELKDSHDSTLEVSAVDLKNASNLRFTDSVTDIESADIYIITVPTPIDAHNRPNIKYLIEASKVVGSVLNRDNIVIYESTVYPGATEEDCVPVLEKKSNLKYNKDFFCGYSPERINPGDKSRPISSICKITSGSNPQIADKIDDLYKTIISAGTHKASSIKVAEAAKVIENTQRDLNIALVNELAIIFELMNIDTEAVLKAAGTKWNFMPFHPGLVGGHCIGVDPYYLTHKAESVGYYPQVILSGRKINDGMGKYVAGQMIKAIIKNGISTKNLRVLILGFAFKENCPDIRNTRVIDVISELSDYGIAVDVYDPWVNLKDAISEYNITLTENPDKGSYDGIILAVAHDIFKNIGADGLKRFGKKEHIFYDLKYQIDPSLSDLRL
jgi:UDP-N-acetyl-D-glucosamine/UDP-N-acetyl-D-galactosamine dehydrogenase